MRGWKTATLGDVCSLIARGIAPKYVENEGVLVINQKCIRGHTVDYSLGRRHDAGAKRVATDRFIQPGDVLINSTGTGTLGRVAQVRTAAPEPTTVDTHVTVVRPMPGEFYPDFFGYALVLLENQLAASGEGASGQTELARTTVSKFEISYPICLEEQRRIVAILDEAFAAIATATANAEKNLANARELFESNAEHMFRGRGEGWKDVPLGRICDFLNGFAFKSSDAVANSRTQLVRMGNLYGGTVDLERKAAYYPDRFAVEYERYALREGDIIISLTGTVGKEDYGFAAKVPSSNRALLMNQRIAKLEHIKSDMVVSDYLLAYLRSRSFLDKLYRTANGTRQANLSTATMKSITVPLCSIAEQTEILSSLNSLAVATSQLGENYSQKLDAFEALRTSLLHNAFAGELATTGSETIAA